MNDVRPIDANALLKRRRNFGKDYALDPVDKNIDDQLVDLRDVLNAPTLDYAPVSHGEWGEYEAPYGFPSLNGFPCSVCGMHQTDIRGLYYCPNCGAKMDGEK